MQKLKKKPVDLIFELMRDSTLCVFPNKESKIPESFHTLSHFFSLEMS